MSEDIFANMFGEIVSPKSKEEAREENVINVDSTKMKSIPLDENGKAEEHESDVEENNEDEPEKDESAESVSAEKTDDKDDSDLPTKDDVDKAKKELGIGGAAFVDELLTKVPDAFSRLREAGKTLHGLFNFAYSLALKEYTAAHGRVNGGGWWDTETMLAKYLDPSVKEGFAYEEPETKKYTPPTPSKTEAKKVVEKVAKKAAKDAKKSETKAKKAATNKNTKKTKEEKAEEKAKLDAEMKKSADSIASEFANIDFSKFV